MLIISSFAYYFSHEKITQRITQTKGEIEQISKNKLNSSIGLRFQMWNAAIILIPESPIIGLGNEHQKHKEQLSNNNVISESVVEFTHYHNQFLNELVKYGLVGFALLMLTIIYPLYRLKQNNDEKTWPGIIVALIFIVASLTYVPFQHAQTFTFYFIFVDLVLEPHRAFTLNKKSSENCQYNLN